jgi:hypothetical protein
MALRDSFAWRRESQESRGKRKSPAKHQTVAFDPKVTSALWAAMPKPILIHG